jgi:hypothetical protein
MADRKISALTALTSPATGDYLPIVDISEPADADKNKRITYEALQRYYDSDSSNYVAFVAPSTVSSNVTWTLPGADGSNGQVLTTNGAGTLSWGTVSGSGITDGDKGDITVSSGGGTWTIDNDAVTYAKIQNVSATARVLGRSTAGAGDIEEISIGNGLNLSSGTLNANEVIVVPVSDESTALTTGTAKKKFRMPFAATLLAVRASVNTAPTGSTLIVDINEAGTSVLGTKLSIDASETTSTTAASAATITDSALADDAEISIDIDQIGSSVAGAGLKVSLFVRRS